MKGLLMVTRGKRVAASVVAGVAALLVLAGCPESSGCTDEGEQVPVGTIRETGKRGVFETCGKDGRWHRVENPDKGPSGTRA